jgi:hypothetical protein
MGEGQRMLRHSVEIWFDGCTFCIGFLTEGVAVDYCETTTPHWPSIEVFLKTGYLPG